MKRNYFLYLTTFLCGAAIMGVEIASSRFMAPYFGSSMITWTIIIGVIMVAMSIGNLLGGHLADHHDPAQRLYQLILAAALWIAMIPLLGKYLVAAIAVGAVALFPGDAILVGSLCSCIALFATPCIILGATSPCMIKTATENLENNGRVAGEIYGLSTVGSIFGTFLPTFFTIPFLGTDKTFLLFAAILALLALAGAVRRKATVTKPAIMLLLVVLLASLPSLPAFAFWETPLCETESVYNYLLVKKNDAVTTLSTHVLLGTQSMYVPGPGLTGLYYDMALLAHFFLKPVSAFEKLPILVLGFATGTYAKLARQFFPESLIDGVEIDPEIVRLGRQYFALKDSDARVFVEDGRVFVNRTTNRYRIIFLDAFQDVTYPFHMATREFFIRLAEILDEDGVLAVNVNLRSPLRPDLVDYLTGTLRSVFTEVVVCDHPDYYNRIIFAMNNPKMLATFRSRTTGLPPEHPLFSLAEKAAAGIAPATPSQLLLTDDLAPVELIGFKMLNEQVREAWHEILARLIAAVKDNLS